MTKPRKCILSNTVIFPSDGAQTVLEGTQAQNGILMEKQWTSYHQSHLCYFLYSGQRNDTIPHSYTCVVGNASGLLTDCAASHQRNTNETSTCLKWHCFTAPALTSCQHQHFSVCNSFTVIILRLARQNAKLWKPNLIFQDPFFSFSFFFFLPA